MSKRAKLPLTDSPYGSQKLLPSRCCHTKCIHQLLGKDNLETEQQLKYLKLEIEFEEKTKYTSMHESVWKKHNKYNILLASITMANLKQ